MIKPHNEHPSPFKLYLVHMKLLDAIINKTINTQHIGVLISSPWHTQMVGVPPLSNWLIKLYHSHQHKVLLLMITFLVDIPIFVGICVDPYYMKVFNNIYGLMISSILTIFQWDMLISFFDIFLQSVIWCFLFQFS